MPFDAFYVSLLSEKYKSGKMNFIKGFYHGLLSNLSALRTKEYSSLIYLLKVKSKKLFHVEQLNYLSQHLVEIL